jgi:hypothetical protein
MKKVILYDPQGYKRKDRFKVLQINDTLEEYHRMLQCRTITSAQVCGYTVFTDDEALLSETPPPPSVMDSKKNPMIYGRLVFVGDTNRHGDTLTLTDGQIEDILSLPTWDYFNPQMGWMASAIIDLNVDLSQLYKTP